MFVGEYLRTLDKKGRVFIPSDFRDELIKGAVIVKGFDEPCLYLFSYEEWDKLGDQIQPKLITKSDKSRFERWFFSSARKISIDPQGRINIPPELIAHAQLKKDIALIGVSNRIEIWDKDRWENYYKEAENKFLQNNDAIEELGN